MGGSGNVEPLIINIFLACLLPVLQLLLSLYLSVIRMTSDFWTPSAIEPRISPPEEENEKSKQYIVVTSEHLFTIYLFGFNTGIYTKITLFSR